MVASVPSTSHRPRSIGSRAINLSVLALPERSWPVLSIPRGIRDGGQQGQHGPAVGHALMIRARSGSISAFGASRTASGDRVIPEVPASISGCGLSAGDLKSLPHGAAPFPRPTLVRRGPPGLRKMVSGHHTTLHLFPKSLCFLSAHPGTSCAFAGHAVRACRKSGVAVPHPSLNSPSITGVN
jgi:hypothetical protein